MNYQEKTYFIFHIKALEHWMNKGRLKEWWCRSSRCGTTGSVAAVQSLAPYSGLMMWCCHSCSVGYNCDLDLIPGPGTPYAVGWPKEKREKKKKKRRCIWLLKQKKQKNLDAYFKRKIYLTYQKWVVYVAALWKFFAF